MNTRENNSIPSIRQCREIMVRYGMLPNIVEHSEQVMRVSLAIADNLKDPGSVNRDIIAASSLLHDITKTRSLETGERHDLSGATLLEYMGYGNLAGIVRRHVFYEDFEPDGRLTDADIVYYADKRVMHTRIVSVEERVADLIERYGSSPERREWISRNKDFILGVESKIGAHMKIPIESAIVETVHE